MNYVIIYCALVWIVFIMRVIVNYQSLHFCVNTIIDNHLYMMRKFFGFTIANITIIVTFLTSPLWLPIALCYQFITNEYSLESNDDHLQRY